MWDSTLWVKAVYALGAGGVQALRLKGDHCCHCLPSGPVFCPRFALVPCNILGIVLVFFFLEMIPILFSWNNSWTFLTFFRPRIISSYL